MQQVPPREFEDLPACLRRTRGIDFTTYKYPSLVRRFRRRLQHLGIETFSDYQDDLEVHADEFAQLFNTVLINVTDSFRDTATWDYLKAEIIPRFLGKSETMLTRGHLFAPVELLMGEHKLSVSVPSDN